MFLTTSQGKQVHIFEIPTSHKMLVTRDVPPIFNNQDFIDAFAQSFISFAISLDPNVRVNGSTSILPQWPLYSDGGLEMIFGRDGDSPAIATKKSDSELLERCK